MIASGVVVYVSCQPVDFRKGAASLMALVRDGGLDPFSGALHVFRSKRAQHATFCIQSSKRYDCISLAFPFWTECGAAINVRARIASRNDAPRDSSVASSILLPAWGEGGRARWPGFRSARPPSRARRRLSVALRSPGSAAPCSRGQTATHPPVRCARPLAGRSKHLVRVIAGILGLQSRQKFAAGSPWFGFEPIS